MSNPILMLRYRDDGTGEWSNIEHIDLGALGDRNFHVKLFRLGTYESRQYEISCSDNTPLVLSNAQEDITELR